MRSNLLPIAKEGLNYVIISALLLIFFMIFDFDFLEFLTFFTTLFFIFIFRNPERESMLYQENSVVSPVDGAVTSIEELENDNDYAYKIDIDGSYFNVALLRTPFTSSLEEITIYKGARLSPFNSLSKELNENAALVFKDKSSSNKIKIVHRLKQSIKSIDIDIIKAQNLLQGSRYGLMVNGITSIYLPHNFRLNISVGAELMASETLLGYFTTDKKSK